MKNNKLYFGLLGLLIISVFAFSFVSAAETSAQIGVFKQLWDAFFGGIFTGSSFSIGTYETSITQILLGLLVILLVYSIADFIPLLPNGWIQWVFSIVVGLLAFLFIDSETITSIGDTYQALGVALASVIPLLILLGFSFKLSSDERAATFAPFLDKFVFLIFGIWMVLKWSANGATLSDYSAAYLASAVIAILWVFAASWIKRFLNRRNREDVDQRQTQKADDRAVRGMKNRLDEVDERLKNLVGYLDKDSNQEREDLITEKRKIEKDIAEFQKARST